MLTFNQGSIFVFLFHCCVWCFSVICPRWALQSHSPFNSTPILHLRSNSVNPAAFIPTPGHLRLSPEEPTCMQKTLKNMSEKISLNNHGLDQEWQTNEIPCVLRAQWWWAYASSFTPLAASHKSSSHFLESHQLTVFPLCYGHKQWQTCLVWHCSAGPYLDPIAAPDGESAVPPNSLYVGCKYLICFVWVKCHGGCDFLTIASGSLTSIVHNSLWQAGSFQHLKAENRKGHLQGGDTMCAWL